MKSTKNYSLSTTFAANREIDEFQGLWNLFISPLVFGPIRILDNMLLDNAQLYKIFTNDQYVPLLKRYAHHGLVTILYREYWDDSNPKKVNTAEDILCNWLYRTDKTGLESVVFGMLKRVSFNDGDGQGQSPEKTLQDKIRKWNKQKLGRMMRLDGFYNFMKIYNFDDYKKLVKNVNEIFFNSGISDNIAFTKWPAGLHIRTLNAFGLPNSEELIRKCSGDPKVLIKSVKDQNEFREGAKLFGDEFRELLNGDFDYVYEFFRICASNRNPTYEAISGLFENCTLEFGDKIRSAILNTYDFGIAEANEIPILAQKPSTPSITSVQRDLELQELSQIILHIDKVFDLLTEELLKIILDGKILGTPRAFDKMKKILFPNMFIRISSLPDQYRKMIQRLSKCTTDSILRLPIQMLADVALENEQLQVFYKSIGLNQGFDQRLQVFFLNAPNSQNVEFYRLSWKFYLDGHCLISDVEFV